MSHATVMKKGVDGLEAAACGAMRRLLGQIEPVSRLSGRLQFFVPRDVVYGRGQRFIEKKHAAALWREERLLRGEAAMRNERIVACTTHDGDSTSLCTDKVGEG